MRKLRILITNNTLGGRAGTELYVRDIALKLIKLGHNPIAYSAELGEVAKEMRRNTIPVVDNLDKIGEPPDIIHGHHHMYTMSALLKFPKVPAVYFCHGWLPWEEDPPVFPRILKYVAVDDLCKERLISESGISEDKVKVIYNFADSLRFLPRDPLPIKPRKALLFSNSADEKIVREACEQLNIRLDCVGGRFGKSHERPEELLSQYDLVFGKARCAIEALFVGCAVIVFDAAGAGGLVTSQNLVELKSLNFGVRCMQTTPSVEYIKNQISLYDSADVLAVSKLMRENSDIDATMTEILAIYNSVMEEYSTISLSSISPEISLNHELEATSKYMSNLRMHIRDWINSYRAQISHLNFHYERAQNQAWAAATSYDVAKEEALVAISSCDVAKNEALLATSSYDMLKKEAMAMASSMEVMQNHVNEINENFNSFQGRLDLLTNEKNSLEHKIKEIENSKTIMLRNKIMNNPVMKCYKYFT